MASTQTFLTAVFCAAVIGGGAMAIGGLLADGSSQHERNVGRAMVAKAYYAGAVCEQTGPTSFQIVDEGHTKKPFYTMNGRKNPNTRDTVDGWATASDGSRAKMSVNLGAHTCHVPFGIGDFALKVD